MIGNIHTNTLVHRQRSHLLVRQDLLWDAVLCVNVVLKWTRGKMLQSALVQNSDTVGYVLWCLCCLLNPKRIELCLKWINVMKKDSAQCNIFRILFEVHRGICVKYFWPDPRYFLYQYIIYWLVQKNFPADMNLQMRRYQEYSNKYFYSVNTVKPSKSAFITKWETTFLSFILPFFSQKFSPLAFLQSYLFEAHVDHCGQCCLKVSVWCWVIFFVVFYYFCLLNSIILITLYSNNFTISTSTVKSRQK